MAAEGGAIVTFIFNGEDSDDIPRNITHLIIHENITVIPARRFSHYPNLIEVYCHAGVRKIEREAFFYCRSLRRVIIPGVTIIEDRAFMNYCHNLVHVECDKVERIEEYAFSGCGLSSINLPSAKIVGTGAFYDCPSMTQGIFGNDLESIEKGAFNSCSSLESITIPLKNGLLTDDDIFKRCANLKRVNLAEGESLRDVTNALQLADWRNDMNEVLDSINQILPVTYDGYVYDSDESDDEYYEFYNTGGRKAIAIREWIESVHRKIIHYKAAHCELLDEAASELQHSLPNDIVMNNILPFVELPAHSFDGEDIE